MKGFQPFLLFHLPLHLSNKILPYIDRIVIRSNTDQITLCRSNVIVHRISFQINGETGHKTTYSKIIQDTVNTATGLRKLGVKRGDVLAFCSENRDEYIAAALGAVCCGATITTANMQYSKGDVLT